MNKLGILFAASTIFVMSAKAQTPVTRVITDFKGFWSSQTSAISPVLPDSSHMLLGFSYGANVFSTGVADSVLVSHNVPFKPALFNAFQPSSNTIMRDNSTVIGVGYKYGGPGNVDPVPVNSDFSGYLQDGVRGLDLGTAIFNAVPSNILYTIDATNDSAIADGKPDILVTQVGEPPASATKDSFRFIDINGVTVGHAVAVSVAGLSVIANASWKFYNTDNPITYNSGLLGNREMRMVAFDFSDFGISLANIGSIKRFVHRVSGQSDQAFVAYNTTSFSPTTGQPLPISLIAFDAEKLNQKALLNWKVADAENVRSFAVERSNSDNNFSVIGKVAFIEHQSDYSFVDLNPISAINLYRLKIEYTDGTSSTSGVQKLDFSALDESSYAIYPNPVTDFVTIEALDPKDVVVIRNSIGVPVNHVTRTGSTLDMSGLTPGIYFISISRGAVDVQTKAVIKK
jgi:hypothetical protein